MSLKTSASAAALILLTALQPAGFAAEAVSAKATVSAPENIPTLEPITVIGRPEDPLTGSNTLDRATLEHLPAKNASINEAISVLPRVQLGEGQRTSERAGEILPPLVSISGARPYENLYSVDGVNLNSLLDPLADNPTAIDSVPGHTQRTFVHPGLIDSITVYNSNIPARYGRFLGGVIDARTREPASTFGGTLSYRTTQDAWAEQHINPAREEDFTASADHNRQPDYLKFETGLILDIPLNETSGLLAAFNTLRSEIDLTHLGQPREQDRTLDNYFLKYAWRPASPWSLELTGTYTPSDETYFLKNTLDSDFTIERGGYSLNGILTGQLSAGELSLSAAYVASENSRNAPNAFLSWRNAPSTNWGSANGLSKSNEGGYGSIVTQEESLQLRADMVLEPLKLGASTHTFELGLELTRDSGDFDRQEEAYVFNSSVVKPAAAALPWLICADGDPACNDDEQYFTARNVYAAGGASATVLHQAYYVEDLISLGRFTLRPGLRLSHDDFLDNTNLSHRLAGDWDLFGNGKTRLIAGHNRYYGEALLTYKLREALTLPERQIRALDTTSHTVSPWAFDRFITSTLNQFSSLDTPYSDELVFGIKQQVLGGELALDYVQRRHRDQFARSKITEIVAGQSQNYYVLNNNGSSNYQSWSLAWERQWQKHYLHINYTDSDVTGSNEEYDTTLELADLGEKVWYDGSEIDREDLPRLDYYRPRVFNLVYVGRLPCGFTFSNITKYQSGYEAIDKLSGPEKTALGITTASAYWKKRYPSSWMFDWRIDWEKQISNAQALMLSLEINNVFDKKVSTGIDGDIYELGREFWLGMTYKF